MNYIKLFSEINKNNTSEVGGKGASLGEMTQAGIPIPLGFVVTVDTYKEFIGQELPVDVRDQILEAFDQLGAERVAVRSSAVAEDSSAASWAGQLESYLNTTRDTLIENIRKCWNSIKSERALAYAAEQNLPEDKLQVAVVVQKMVDSEASGVIFSVNPITKDNNEIMIEAGFGLGEMLVQGMITPDNFIVDKTNFQIKERTIETQEKMLVYKDGLNQEVEVPKDKQSKQCIGDKDVEELARLAVRIEEHYGFPCDIEWAKQGDDLFIVQSRPITTLALDTKDELLTEEKPVLTGVGASQGVRSGRVRLIKDLKEISSTQPGEVLVTEKTTPDFIEAFGKVVAVITDSGGVISHAAIVSRELGIPAVVGTKTATTELKNGDFVTVDGNTGKVYKGELKIDSKDEQKDFFTKIEKSGDEITDMVNAMCSSAIDARELWPVAPAALFAYIDFDHTYDMYLKLKSLIDEGWSFKEIAKLFRYPTVTKFFMMNSAATGLKTGVSLKLAPITMDDNVEMFKWFIEILKNLTQEDPFALEGKNIIWSKEEVGDFINQHEWIDLKDNSSLKSAVNLLSVNLFTLCWSFYSDYFGANGSERHGPYLLENEKFGTGAKLLVRDFYDLNPEEIWPEAKDVPFKSIVLAQIYNDTPIYLGWGNGLVNQKSLTEHNSFFTLLVDGKPITDEAEIQKLNATISKIAQKQAEYVNSLEIKDKVRKCAMLAYYGLKSFYLHFSDKWYPEEKIEKMFEIVGDGPLNSKETKERTLEEKKELFDPRIPWNP